MSLVEQHLWVPESHCHCFLLWGDTPWNIINVFVCVCVGVGGGSNERKMTRFYWPAEHEQCVCCFSHLPAVKPSRGDGVDADRCVNEQHDGENIRSLLHRPHVGCEGAGQHCCGITWKGKMLTHAHTHTQQDKNLWTVLHLLIALFTPLSLQVNKYAKELLAAMSSGMEEKDDPGKLTAESFPVVWILKAYSLLAWFFFLHSC